MELLEQPTTPTQSSGIRTPPTPKHGYSDPWEPYALRKSTRLSSQRSKNRTPSPQPSARLSEPRHNPTGSPRSKKKTSTTVAAMASPATSPRKKRAPATDRLHRASAGILAAADDDDESAHLGLNYSHLPEPTTTSSTTRSTRSTMPTGAGMLPTPAKTPQKPPSEQSKAKIRAVARNLFHHGSGSGTNNNDVDADVMPTPRRTRTAKKHILDSFSAEETEETIRIYTDSHERVPEVDAADENPFYGGSTTRGPPAAAAESSRRRSKRQQVTIPGEGKVSIEEAVRREDGMLIVFRGKKQFRKFSDKDEASNSAGEESGEAADAASDDNIAPHLKRPLTRSSIKPRLLFPAKAAAAKNGEAHRAAGSHGLNGDDDEEAATDIEDHVLAAHGGREADDDEAALPQTPADLVDEQPDTPVAPRFAPASPPTTARTTRHGLKAAEDATPMKPSRTSKRSPFDGWRRVKNSSGSSHHKRSGEPLATEAAKRTRT